MTNVKHFLMYELAIYILCIKMITSILIIWELCMPYVRSLMGSGPWGHKELDITEVAYHACTHMCNTYFRASLMAQMVKNLPAMQKTWVQSLGQEDPLEKGMATHSSILAWEILRTEEPGRIQSMESQRVGHDWKTTLYFFLYVI